VLQLYGKYETNNIFLLLAALKTFVFKGTRGVLFNQRLELGRFQLVEVKVMVHLLLLPRPQFLRHNSMVLLAAG
jgi:hypothetical protein